MVGSVPAIFHYIMVLYKYNCRIRRRHTDSHYRGEEESSRVTGHRFKMLSILVERKVRLSILSMFQGSPTQLRGESLKMEGILKSLNGVLSPMLKVRSFKMKISGLCSFCRGACPKFCRFNHHKHLTGRPRPSM